MAPTPRGFDNNEIYNASTSNLLYGFFLLVLVACSLSLILFCLRRRRKAAAARAAMTFNTSNLCRDRWAQDEIEREQIYVYDDKMNLVSKSGHLPARSVPEIHITFPEEEGQEGHRTAGRVVVVKLTDGGHLGLEPLQPEQLPAYQQQDAGRFHSLDLNRIGGLREAPP